MSDAGLREPAGLAGHIEGLCGLLEQLWPSLQNGHNAVLSRYRITAGALIASARLVFHLDGRYDPEWTDEIATQLADAGARVQIGLDQPSLPQDFTGGIKRAREAINQLRTAHA